MNNLVRWPWTSYEYDAAGNRTATTDPNGNRWQSEYDALGYVTAEIAPNGARTEFAYDAMGNLAQQTDALGRVTRMEFGDLQLPVRVVDANDNERLLSYDWQGNLLSETDANGNLRTYAYDELNRLSSSIDPLGHEVTYGYDAAGNRTRVTDERGNTTQISYDELNRPASWTDPAGATIKQIYDAKGRVLQSIDAAGAVTQFSYDPMGRLLNRTDPLGSVSSWTYDLAGNVLAATDPLDRTTTGIYDPLNRRIRSTDPRGATTQFSYDAVGNLTELTDPIGNTTTFSYDSLDRIVSVTDALGSTATTAYDAIGNVSQRVDRNGRQKTYAYDNLDRLVAETWWQDADAVNTLHYSYDAVGNVLTASDDLSRYTHTYDALNRLVTVDNTGTSSSRHVVLTNAYDAVGNRISVSDDAGVTVASGYDSRNQLTTRQWFGGTIGDASMRLRYDPRGLPVQLQRFASLDTSQLISSTDYDFDDKLRLSELTHRDGLGQAIVDYEYTRDLADQLIREVHHGQTFDYTRDAGGQLLTATVNSVGTENYAYDANGNRLDSLVVTGTDNRLTEDADYRYDHDAEGNLIRRTDKLSLHYTEYSYDHRNRLTLAEDYDANANVISSVVNVFDIFDRQISRLHDPDGDGPLTADVRHTVYDGPHAWADYDESGDVTARYLFGDGIDQIAARWRPGDQPGDGTAWYLSDHLGTIREMVDASGNVINAITYDSFGRILTQTDPSVSDRFAFTGREWDEAMGLYYYRARFYDPVNGRFTSQDPLGFAAGDTNLYRYVGNNPLDYVDPSGNLAMTECAFVQHATRALNMVCPAIQMILNDDFSMEGLTPEEQAAKGIEATFSLLNVAASVMPFGSAPAFQMVMKAVTITTTAQSIASIVANGHLFNIMGMAETYVREAYAIVNDPLATFQEAMQAYSGKSLSEKGAFWSEIACGAANMALMVYSAKARCFVAGTPVVVGILPPNPTQKRSAEELANVARIAEDGVTALDVFGGLALIGAISLQARKKRKNENGATLTKPIASDEFTWMFAGDGEPEMRTSDNSPTLDEDVLQSLAIDQQDGPHDWDAAQADRVQSLPEPVLQAKPIERSGTPPAQRAVTASRKPPHFLYTLGILGCLALSLTLFSSRISNWFAGQPAIAGSAPAPTSEITASSPRLLTKPIEEIRCGDRIPSQLPEGLLPEDQPEPDPATWRLVELELTKQDGHKVEVKLLRPLEWLQQAGAVNSGTFQVNVEELDIDGEAAVLRVLPCPPLQAGEGQVVTGTFRHFSDQLVAVRIAGEPEPIVCTSGHLFWSAGRQKFVSAAALKRTENVSFNSNALGAVLSVRASEGTEPVYNLEINATHVYQVGSQGILVHNATFGNCAGASSVGKLSQPLRNKMKRIGNGIAAGGNRGISGAVSSADALILGQRFVGPGYRVMSGNKGLISADGLRQFRFPAAKRGVNPVTGRPWSKTGIQANFESRLEAAGEWLNNVHLDALK